MISQSEFLKYFLHLFNCVILLFEQRLSGEYGKIPLKAFLKTNEHFRDEFEFLTAAHTSVKLILQNSMMAN